MTRHSDRHGKSGSGGAGRRGELAGGDGNASPDAPISSALDADQVRAPAEEPTQAVDFTSALNEERDRYLRLAAEFDNFRRRTNRERQEMGARAQASLAAALLESLDDLSRVTSMRTEGADATSFVEGVDMVARKLMKSLSAAGLEKVEPLNAKFDPSLQEAVSTEPAASPDEDDTIAAVFQPGYLFKGQLLRPAQVVVRKWHG